MRIIHIIKSPSFDSDGRLQKWLSQLRKHNYHSKVFIVEDTNESYKKNIKHDVVVSKELFFRKFFKQRKGYLLKIPEYFVKTLRFTAKEKYDVLVFHDVQQYLSLIYFLLSHKKRRFKIIWDLHELPHEFIIKNPLSKKLLKFILNNVDVVVHTNKERREYLLNKIEGVKEKKFFILNNFPDEDFILSPKKEINLDTIKNENPYILWLGAAMSGRNFGPFLEAYKNFSDSFNLVILGKVEKMFVEELTSLKNQGKLFNEFVNQSEIVNYIDNSYLSVVLYNSHSINNYLCEPNRLYQLISRNIPIVVGENPVMASLVNEYKLGFVLKDDGRDAVELIKGIQFVIDNYDEFVANSKMVDFSKILSWENQMEHIINEISENQ